MGCREEFHAVVRLLEKIARDGRQLVKGGGSVQPKIGQLQQRIGIKPSLADCLEGLVQLHDMHHSEYGCPLFDHFAVCKLLNCIAD